jgi:hypothetical protein
MEKAVWISFDLGLKGDYQSLFQWLDKHQAVECGRNLAFLNVVVDKNIPLADFIKDDLTKFVAFNESDRIYLTWLDNSENQPKIKGEFIIGKRTRSTWEGYAKDYQEVKTDEAA